VRVPLMTIVSLTRSQPLSVQGPSSESGFTGLRSVDHRFPMTFATGRDCDYGNLSPSFSLVGGVFSDDRPRIKMSRNHPPDGVSEPAAD